MAFQDRLKEARTKNGLTQEKLAQKIGVAKSTYTGYEKGNSEPNMLVLSKLMDALEVDANFLFQDETRIRHDTHATPEEMDHLVKKYRFLDPYGKEAVDGVLDVEYRRCKEEEDKAKAAAEAAKAPLAQTESEEAIAFGILPLFLQPSSAGAGQEAGEGYAEEIQLIKEPPRGASFLVRVSGDSMEPTYHNGDLLFVAGRPEIRRGQIGIFLMDGQQYVKELGEGVLISHNPEYAPRPIKPGTLCQGLVLGVCDKSYLE